MIKIITVILSLLHYGVSFSNTSNDKYFKSISTVGPDSNCDFNTTQGFTLQDALDSQASEIRLVNSVIYSGTFIPIASTNIRGAYNTCLDAVADIQGDTLSILDGNSQGSVLTLNISGTYTLDQIKLTNGLANAPAPNNRGGGLKLMANDMVVNLNQVTIENNTAFLGAGIHKSDDNGFPRNILLTIVDSTIKNNTTSTGGIGGGIYYQGLGELIVYGNTLFTQNQAEFGGGAYLKNTIATFVAGSNSPLGSGFIGNKAYQNAAGIYANASTLKITGGLLNIVGIGLLGVSGKNYSITDNTADFDDNSTGIGGGLFLYNNSHVTLNAVSIINNHAYEGGGIYSYQGTQLSIGFPENSRCQTTNSNGCNFFINNNANTGGAFYATTNTQSHLISVNFNGNRANGATVASIHSNSALNMESIVMYNNGDLGNNGYTDNYTLGTFSSSTLNIEHSTAVKNKNTNSFILAASGNNLLNSYNNYFFNPQSGPWLDSNTGPTSVVDFECQIVDSANNNNDIVNNIITITANDNDNLFFVNELNHDYHIKDGSLLVDYVGTHCPTNLNLFNHNKDMDNDSRTSLSDLGADENLSNDIIFEDGFEHIISQ